MEEALEWASNHWGLCAFILAAFVQFTPAIKFNPLTWFGNLFLGGIKKEIQGVQSTVDENEKDRIRWEVLDFANACRNGIRHTKDEFQHIITLKGKYETLLKKTGDKNGVFDAEYRYILDLYKERQAKNDFL